MRVEFFKHALISTNKKDEHGRPRQDNLTETYDGELLVYFYDNNSKKYIISNKYGDEIGGLSKSVSEKIL